MPSSSSNHSWTFRVSWSVLAICALQAVFWFSPMLTVASPVVVSPVERMEALDFYQSSQLIGFTDAPAAMHHQRQQLAIGAAQVAAQQHAAFRLQKALAMEQQVASSAHKSGVPLLGALALAGSVMFMSMSRGGGGGRLRTASASSGGGGGGGGGGSSAGANAAAKRAADAFVENAGAGVAALVGAAALGATGAALLVARRGRGSNSVRQASSGVLGALRRSEATLHNGAGKSMAPMAEMARVERPPLVASPAAAARSFEVVPPHALKSAPVAQCAPGSGSSNNSSSDGVAACAPSASEKAAVAKLSPTQLQALDDATLADMVRSGALPSYSLETTLGDLVRAVRVRRMSIATNGSLDALPFLHYDYANVVGACAENVLGYVPVPIGVAGPVLMDGELVHIPMATTEGCLIASTHRGCKAITESGGALTVLHSDGMTRAPAVRMPSVQRAGELMKWLNTPEATEILRKAFQSTTRFGKLLDVEGHMAGRTVYIRFRAQTGDAMGMNMISKGVECALDALSAIFPDADVMALSGNVCTDKKPSAINWIQGRGKSVVAEAIVKKAIVEKVLKTSVDALVELNVSKNLVGSAMAGSIGGFNAHAANIVTAMYIATGQDPAQNVESSNCMTLMEKAGEDLRISVTMPSIECASIGGGTHLPAQSAALALMGAKGANRESPGANAQKFARAVAVATLAGELSLMSALTAGHLVRSHMALNRKH